MYLFYWLAQAIHRFRCRTNRRKKYSRNPPALIPLDHFSSFTRFKCVTAWILRFLSNCRHTVQTSDLSLFKSCPQQRITGYIFHKKGNQEGRVLTVCSLSIRSWIRFVLVEEYEMLSSVTLFTTQPSYMGSIESVSSLFPHVYSTLGPHLSVHRSAVTVTLYSVVLCVVTYQQDLSPRTTDSWPGVWPCWRRLRWSCLCEVWLRS